MGSRYTGVGIYLDDLAQDSTSLSEPGWRIVGNQFSASGTAWSILSLTAVVTSSLTLR